MFNIPIDFDHKKLNFQNDLSENRLDQFVQMHFWQLNTPIVLQYWIKLTGIIYEDKFETLQKN